MKDSKWVGDRGGRKGAVRRGGEGVGKRDREDRMREEEQGRQGTGMSGMRTASRKGGAGKTSGHSDR